MKNVLLLLSLLVIGSAFAGESPADTAKKFHDLLKANKGDAIKAALIKPGEGKFLEGDLKILFKYADKVEKGKEDFVVVEAVEEKDCAVVIINQNKQDGKKDTDLDPMYMLKQDGAWKVLTSFSTWDRDYYKLQPAQTEAFKKLEKEFLKRKHEQKNGRIPPKKK
ncbi:MAG TPA: hypothetical protein VEK08_09720 [Planctomycetota bacterium]|nr:hypothetical protein [Planctomycetota bacterium]